MNQDNDKNRNSNWNSFILIQDFPEIFLFLILWMSNITEIGLQWFCPFHILLVHIRVALLTAVDGLFASRKEKIQLKLFESLTRVLVFHQKPQGNKAYRHSAMYRLSVIFYHSF